MKADNYRRLGELLVEHGFISERQLQVALFDQRAGKRRLGEVLVERGYVDDMAIAECLADQYGHPLVDLATTTVDQNVAALLSPEFAVTLRALPFARTEDGLAVAISDPVDAATTDQLYFLLRTRLEFHVAPIGALDRQIRTVYGLSDESTDVVAPEASKAPRRFAKIQLRLRSEFGVLFAAYDALLDRNVSLFCQPSKASDARITDIIRAAASTCDPGLVAVYDLTEDKEFSWTVLQPLPADNLARILKVRGPRSVSQAAEIVVTVAEAVDAMARNGRPHDWVTPENIFLGSSGPILAPIGYGKLEGKSEPNSKDAVRALGALLQACLVRPGSAEEKDLPFQMREILFRALGTEGYETPIEIAEALRSYNWDAIAQYSSTTTMDEREQLLEAMHDTEVIHIEPTFWQRLFGRSAA